MSVFMATATCVCCGHLFTFHLKKVPVVKLESGRYPVCRNCINTANPLRVAKGLDPIAIPPGAYGPAGEDEITWEVDNVH